MHGEIKMRTEGLRTRDGHLLEWIGRLRPATVVSVVSRPEPWPRVSVARMRGGALPSTLHTTTPQPLAIPSLRSRQLWWITSQRYCVPLAPDAPVVAWNPIDGARAARALPRDTRLVFDLLDDWLAHASFAPIRPELEVAYSEVLDRASRVTANSEATLRLANRFGRDDAVLVPNGVDPERFDNNVLPTPNSPWDMAAKSASGSTSSWLRRRPEPCLKCDLSSRGRSLGVARHVASDATRT